MSLIDANYHYHLPPQLIAHTPAEPRDSARLLLWPQQVEHTFAQLPQHLQAGDVLVVNTSSVISARIFATRPNREKGTPIAIELLLHRKLAEEFHWHAFAKPAKRLSVGDVLTLTGGQTATVIAVGGAGGQITLDLPLGGPALQAYLAQHGHTPLPPYIQAPNPNQFTQRYQTVYANSAQAGSVAAPTAGLHFTPAVLQALTAKGVHIHSVMLHVGAGTFLNPTAEQIATQTLHAEYAELPAETAQAITAARARGSQVIAVGTTALRTLEGAATAQNLQPHQPLQPWSGDITLFIQPGYWFKVVDKLLTNFHLPGSSLLMLVAAFIGLPATQALYAHAIAQNFRFFSFGDTSLLTRQA